MDMSTKDDLFRAAGTHAGVLHRQPMKFRPEPRKSRPEPKKSRPEPRKSRPERGPFKTGSGRW